MSGDAFRKVSPGQPFSMPAEIYNAIVDVATEVLHGKLNSAGILPSAAQNGIVEVRNDTGGTLSRFDVVGLEGVVFDPASSSQADAFKNGKVMKAVTPEFDNGHILQWGVMQAPAAAGSLGKCLVAGFSAVKLAVNKSWHKYAAPVDGSTAHLESSPSGDAVIQWASGGEGGAADWALVALHAGIPEILFGKAQTNWNNAADDASYVEVYPCENLDGDGVDTSKTIKVWLPRLGRDEDPNVVADTVLPYMLSDPAASTPEGVCIGEYLDGKIDVSLRLQVKDSAIPAGWQQVAAADKKTVAFNDNPVDRDSAQITGYDEHGGNGVNDHQDHAVSLMLDWQQLKHPADGSLVDHVGPGAQADIQDAPSPDNYSPA